MQRGARSNFACQASQVAEIRGMLHHIPARLTINCLKMYPEE
jgi:hypothetical protein